MSTKKLDEEQRNAIMAPPFKFPGNIYEIVIRMIQRIKQLQDQAKRVGVDRMVSDAVEIVDLYGEPRISTVCTEIEKLVNNRDHFEITTSNIHLAGWRTRKLDEYIMLRLMLADRDFRITRKNRQKVDSVSKLDYEPYFQSFTIPLIASLKRQLKIEEDQWKGGDSDLCRAVEAFDHRRLEAAKLFAISAAMNPEGFYLLLFNCHDFMSASQFYEERNVEPADRHLAIMAEVVVAIESGIPLSLRMDLGGGGSHALKTKVKKLYSDTDPENRK